jgi:hypothetical protein
MQSRWVEAADLNRQIIDTYPKDIEAHIFLNGDARVFAVDDEGLGSTEVICYVPRPPK